MRTPVQAGSRPSSAPRAAIRGRSALGMTTSEPSPPTLSLTRLFLKFLRFGCLDFGGPVAQIAMVRHALVEEERWISPARFNRLLAVMQILPGPEDRKSVV